MQEYCRRCTRAAGRFEEALSSHFVPYGSCSSSIPKQCLGMFNESAHGLLESTIERVKASRD